MVKPDGVQRGLVGEIVKRFEQKGFKLVALKFMKVRNSDSVFLTLFVPNQELWNFLMRCCSSLCENSYLIDD